MAPKIHQNHYEILSLPETCTAEEVNRRYKVLSMRHHPDKGGDANVMATINHARDVLTDLTAREEFHDATCRPPLRGFRPPPRSSFGDSPFERTTFGPAPQSAPPIPKRGAYAPKPHADIERAERHQREPTPPPEDRPLKRAGARRARPAPPPSMRAEAGGAEPCAQPVVEKERDDWWEDLVKDWDFDRQLTEEEKALADPEIQEMWSKWF
ncbi:unnamed protein product [Zymoseptoria tritici ST99CH_1A5]|uniref:J domain-containing protein n=4 Tax=Zymoseptoria tritici TaxID=1047171 RepID=F9XDW4_ZYMTI|nr:uncharacterized protein MYCGRDRAFT_94054 [Zymoseptoria tritici IPO323]EGP86728.1 hypothetical protein MYCGRDRAFT_94054 [Zymoseptoria tritici IPO323]SMQ51924.1 unnamed protein product [Zymoseptoria tritici ST99CH_3D7]SMR54447.1 unnamed protein product [Zymoseptoria tritici ST99CH_1E4]SMY25567.1 unnamed protein product [Zymoseptoria tritici ST99CH_1A5]